MVADHDSRGRLTELRIYFSVAPDRPPCHRPPLLQRDAEVHESDVVGEYQCALAAGDLDAILATFEADGYAREPAGGEHVHRGHDGLRAFYEQLFSAGGGIPLEHCATIDDGRSSHSSTTSCAGGRPICRRRPGWPSTSRGAGGKLAAARIYDDVDPPLRAGI